MIPEATINKFKGAVRVNCETYNHAPYIEDTLNGFAIQETSAPFTCCIVDDASTDGAQEVIKKYLQGNFNLEDKSLVIEEETDDYVLTYARHKTNKNCYFAVYLLKYNHFSLYKPKEPIVTQWSDTKYIALCEGDDYWTDPLKLQKQINVLDSNPEVGLVYSKAQIFNDKEKQLTGGIWGGEKCQFDDILIKNNIPTLTVMYRRSLDVQYVSEMRDVLLQKKWPIGDKPLWLWIAKHAKLFYIPEILGVYRIVQNSASHQVNLDKKLSFTKYNYEICQYFDQRFNDGKMKDGIDDRYNRDLFKIYARIQPSFFKALRYFLKIHKRTQKDYKTLIRILIK